MMFFYRYKTILGDISIVANLDAITHIFIRKMPVMEYEKWESPLIKTTYQELMEYLEGNRQQFSVPIEMQGTEFQKKVWHALTTIPYGETRSYKRIAEKVGSPKAFRAVGLANNRNPISIIVPCHRVIGADGKMVGYGGGIDVKVKLLEIEANQQTLF